MNGGAHGGVSGPCPNYELALTLWAAFSPKIREMKGRIKSTCFRPIMLPLSTPTPIAFLARFSRQALSKLSFKTFETHFQPWGALNELIEIG